MELNELKRAKEREQFDLVNDIREGRKTTLETAKRRAKNTGGKGCGKA